MQKHITVLLDEAVASLELQKNSVVVDATYGAGGHAEKILEQLDAKGTYIGIDVDPTALESQPKNPHEAVIHLVNDNFSNLDTILGSLHINNSVNAVLADLGWRMDQFSDGGKGLSFQKDEPLHMTYGEADSYPFTAYDVVNEWEESSIADIIFGYGEERAARKIAKAIVTAREEKVIETSFELRDLVAGVVRTRRGSRVHPATKTFQALRIVVNDELQRLESFLKQAFAALEPDGKLAIISFHSLEDRIVKHYFRSQAAAGLASVETKKPIIPSEDEVMGNPRSRSAKLRILKKYNVEQHEQSTNISTFV